VSASICIERLWQEGYFKEGRLLKDVSARITEKWGHNFSAVDISKALSGSQRLRRYGKRGNFRYIHKTSPISKKIATIEEELFSAELIAKLGKDFNKEVEDLHLNFGNSGTCTAFLLRKILEKLLYLVFAKNGIGSKIEDKTKPGHLVGLEKMVNIAAQEKIQNIPLLTPSTAHKINGIKFLGDISAHNPLVNVDMETIAPQMPYIITAYKELATRL